MFCAHLCGGGIIFGAFFMATDYVTSPITPKGQILFGILLGVLTGLFRLFGGSAEGVSYAIIISNILVPLIEKSYPSQRRLERRASKMKKGGFMKDAWILFAITLISGLLLGAVYQITKVPIQMAEAKESLHKYQMAYPDATDFLFDQAIQDQVVLSKETLKEQKPEYGNVEVTVALKAVDASGNVIGHIITASSDDSYGGTVKVSVGITNEGKITGVELLEISDTPGLGMKATEPAFKDQYKDKTVEEFTVTKTGSTSDSEINAISGATITSNAVTHAVDAALYFAANCIPQ